MAKKTNKKKQEKKPEIIENALPQNILPMGERVLEDKNVYISQSVYKQIHKFTKNKTQNESGGMLVGTVLEEFGKTNIIINGFVEAKFCEATPTTLKFTHETWEYCHKEIDKKFDGQKIVGWIHTHPNFGIFLSEYDKFIQENFFREDYQIAYVVDPIQKIEGFYFWINDKIEKCEGFYIFDEAGTKIDIAKPTENTKSEAVSEGKERGFGLQSLLVILLAVCVVILFVMNIGKDAKIDELESRVKNIEQENKQISAEHQQIGQMLYGMLQEIGTPEQDSTNQQQQEQDAGRTEVTPDTPTSNK